MSSRRVDGRARRQGDALVAAVRRIEAALDGHLKAEADTTGVRSSFHPDDLVAQDIQAWQQDRKAAYIVDDALLGEMRRTLLPEEFVPHTLFGRLPHTAPLFVFSSPVALRTTNGNGALEDVLLNGFLASPRRGPDGKLVGCSILTVGQVVATDDMFTLSLLIPFAEQEVNAEDGRVVVIATDVEVNLAHIVRAATGQFGHLWDPHSGERIDTAGGKENGELSGDEFLGFYPTMLNLVLYVTGEDPDLVSIGVPEEDAARHTANLHMLGFQLGPVLRAANGTESPTNPNELLRRPRWHRYWVGPADGQRQMVLRWVNHTLMCAEDARHLPGLHHIN